MAETTYDTPQDIGNGPQGIYRRWMAELSIADKQEADWRKTSNDILDRYRSKNGKKNAFNILWANTETLAPAIFNSTPKPDVRRRYRDADPVGKVVSEVLARDLEFCMDTDEFMHAIKMDVLDMLLPGRGLSRIRYIPSLVQVGTPVPDEDNEEPTHESLEGEQEELAWECVTTEHVQWDDFRRGPGRTWGEVQWVAFRHRMTREDCIRKFGEEIGSQIELNEAEDGDLKQKDNQLQELFNTAEVWELWDKDKRQVLFVSSGYRKGPIKTIEDPLSLNGFFPIPRPLYAIADASTLTPLALYTQYKEQAEELDRISSRINTIVDALKLRGIYDATVTEMADLLRSNDNDLVPTDNATAWMDRAGGLAGAIMWIPIDMAAKVLIELGQQRESCKQIIYEISGVSDVMRAATDPNETLGAQQLKAQYGGQRIQSMQREVQRYIRDMLRLMSEVISSKFQPETLFGMANMKLPTQQEVQMQQMQAQQQYQQQALMAAQQGQQPPPPPQLPPPPITQEQVLEVMHDDIQRSYKVDVETDSTVAATMQEDMQGLQQLLTGITGFMTGMAPIVQSGAMPIDAAKEVIMSVIRRAKMGNAVEDAFDKMKAPTPPPDPNAAKAQADAQIKQAELQAKQQSDAADQRLEAQRIQMEANAEQQRIAMEEQARERDRQHEAILEQQRMESAERLAQFQADLQARLDTERAERDATLQVILAHIKKEQAIEEAEIGSATTLQSAQITAAEQKEPNELDNS